MLLIKGFMLIKVKNILNQKSLSSLKKKLFESDSDFQDEREGLRLV